MLNFVLFLRGSTSFELILHASISALLASTRSKPISHDPGNGQHVLPSDDCRCQVLFLGKTSINRP